MMGLVFTVIQFCTEIHPFIFRLLHVYNLSMCDCFNIMFTLNAIPYIFIQMGIYCSGTFEKNDRLQ